jgi:SAM-dependent methyltransferase
MKLDIILRTCLRSELDHIIRYDDPESKMQRVCGPDRELMMTKCLTSLIIAINNADFPIHFTILDDRSNELFIKKLEVLLSKCNKSHEIIRLTETGFNNSAYQQFYMASQVEDLVYSVEDDYLHESNAITNMLNAYFHFQQITGKPTLLFPMDDIFRYDESKGIGKTKLYYDGTRYWRNVRHTTNTIFTHGSVIKNNFEPFKILAQQYPKVLEDDTINQLYYSEDTDAGIIHAYCPIPSIAYHLSYTPHASIKTSHASWDHIWHQTKLWDLIDGWFQYEQFYTQMVGRLPYGAKVVEVGCWMGKSTACLAQLCKASAKDIVVYAVDTWQGSNEETHREIIAKLAEKEMTLRDMFDQNMTMCGVSREILPLQMTSIEASSLLQDKSIDFVMLDASHTYPDVKQDIEHWLPKIKKGGIISGDDYCPSWQGVVDAVNEKFPNDVQVLGTTWFKIV